MKPKRKADSKPNFLFDRSPILNAVKLTNIPMTVVTNRKIVSRLHPDSHLMHEVAR